MLRCRSEDIRAAIKMIKSRGLMYNMRTTGNKIILCMAFTQNE
jgi:hypothetical protein